MGRESASDIGWIDAYIPPTKQPRLTAGHYCEECAVADICGESFAESSCGHPSEYNVDDFHPATTTKRSLAAELLRLPPSGLGWPSISIKSALTIATDPRPVTPDLFAVGASAVLRLAPGEGLGRVGVLVGNDAQIHKLWRLEGILGQSLKAIGYRYVIAPAFSTWWKGTPLEGLVSMTRSISMIQSLRRHLPVVPTIGWRTGRDLRRWCSWLREDGITCVAVHLGNRENRAWRWNLKGIRIIRELLSQDEVRLIAIGPTTPSRIQSLVGAWGQNLAIASQKPWHLAQQGRSLNSALRGDLNLTMTRTQLAEQNARTFLEVTHHLITRRGLTAI